jgi:DnaJ-class molecular chaperone
MPEKKVCPVCKGSGVVEIEVRAGGSVTKEWRTCSAPECLAGNLARVFRKKEKR